MKNHQITADFAVCFTHRLASSFGSGHNKQLECHVGENTTGCLVWCYVVANQGVEVYRGQNKTMATMCYNDAQPKQ